MIGRNGNWLQMLLNAAKRGGIAIVVAVAVHRALNGDGEPVAHEPRRKRQELQERQIGMWRWHSCEDISSNDQGIRGLPRATPTCL